MSESEGRGGSNSRPVLVADDEDLVPLAVAPPAPSSQSGGTPLRRTSPLVSPSTRLARTTASPDSSRESTPNRLSYESLMSRRRSSNPRTRTPMRYESPLNADAFRRDTNANNGSGESPRREGQRVTVRPLTGAAIGTAVANLRIENRGVTGTARTLTPSRSYKQGPSHRKIRRWNNDGFVGIAAELAKSKPAAAEAFLKAQADAPLYRSVYNPQDMPPSILTKFAEDDDLKELREKFFNGEIAHGPKVPQVRRKKDAREVSPDRMLLRVHTRLRNVLKRACCNSASSAKVVDLFETFLVGSFVEDKTVSLDSIDTLLEPPTITELKTGRIIIRFYFDPDSSAGGFHRLLLHAVGQFHGLNAISSTVEMDSGESKTKARLLTVTGSLTGASVRLVDYVTDEEEPVAVKSQTRQHLAEKVEALKV